jgi:hypothetical protein
MTDFYFEAALLHLVLGQRPLLIAPIMGIEGRTISGFLEVPGLRGIRRITSGSIFDFIKFKQLMVWLYVIMVVTISSG